MKNNSGKKTPTIKLNLTSNWIGPKKIDREFRQVMTELLKFWNKNKNKRNLLLPSEFYDAILRCKGIRLFKRLKTHWTIEESPEIEAYHSVGCEPQLKRVLKNYLKKKKRGPDDPLL